MAEGIKQEVTSDDVWAEGSNPDGVRNLRQGHAGAISFAQQNHFHLENRSPSQIDSMSHAWPNALMGEALIHLAKAGDKKVAAHLFGLALESNPNRRYDLLIHSLNELKPRGQRDPDIIAAPVLEHYTSHGPGIVFNTKDPTFRRSRAHLDNLQHGQYAVPSNPPQTPASYTSAGIGSQGPTYPIKRQK